MAWEARSGLKLVLRKEGLSRCWRLNGLGSPFGIETKTDATIPVVVFDG